MIRSVAAALILLVVSSNLPAQDADDTIRSAVRASLLQKPEEVRSIAQAERTKEQRANLPKKDCISGNIESLAIASARPLPTLSQAKMALSGHPRNDGTKAVDRLLRRVEPRQRFLEARNDRRYEETRRVFNALASPLSSVAQGHFSGLIALPFEAAERVVTGRPFLTPEQRRELIQARSAVERFSPDVLDGKPGRIARHWTAKRRNLAALQAKQNGEKALTEGRIDVAHFWLEREMDLQGWTSPRRDSHHQVRELLLERSAQERANVMVMNGYTLFASSSELTDYARVVHTFVRDARSEQFAEAADDFQLDYPRSRALDAMMAAGAAASTAAGERGLARVELIDLAQVMPAAPWGRRARALTRRLEYRPEIAFTEAKSAANKRLRAFIMSAEDPTVLRRGYSPEEARLRRSLWVDRARTFFVTDMVARALFLPFMSSFPRPEILDTAGKVDPEWFNTPQGRGWLLEVARAQRIDKRYASAAESYKRLGDAGRATSMEEKAARRLERIADRSPDPREAVAVYQRILNAYPLYKRISRVERSLDEAHVRVHSIVTITPKELRSWPELTGPETLNLNPGLLDGKKKNGEISREGLALLQYDAISFIDLATGRRVELPIEDEAKNSVLRLYEPRRRGAVTEEELLKPLPRKRIPAAIEAGIFPGFDIAPALVPLDPDLRERELYR